VSAPPTAAAVVLSWNRREDTLACLESLEAATYPALRIVCVDNGSSDGSADAVASRFPDTLVRRLPTNLGFAGGMNEGIRAALEDGAEHVFLLNNDMLVEPGFMEPLVAALAVDPGAAAACSQVVLAGSPDRTWYAGARFRPRRGYHGRHVRYGEPPLPPSVPAYTTERACAGAMLVTRSVLERVGLFDDALFAYGEDVDWSLRARSHGLHVLVVPASVVSHKVSASSGGESSPATIYYNLRNGLVVSERWAPLGRAGTIMRRVEAVLAHVAQALLFSPRRVKALRAVRAGWRDFRRGHFGPSTTLAAGVSDDGP
jgi:GT2 family glycosyltransferase